MAIYYVRKTGSDASAGTSAGAAWLTIGKALGAAGIASGDTVYVGAGVYREVVTINMTSATVETKIIGDVDGVKTGDAGEVQWTAYLTGDIGAPSATALLTTNGRDFLTFQDIVFQFGAANGILGTTNTSTNITFYRCLLAAGGTGVNRLIDITSAANVALNWLFDSCIIMRTTNNAGFNITPVRPATADFDINFVVKNCLIIGGSSSLIVGNTPSGANTFNPGGVLAYNNTYMGVGAFITTITANWSTSIPWKAYNNVIMTGGNVSQMQAGAAGQVIEDYNYFMNGATAFVNVTAGAHSITSGAMAPLLFTGHEYLTGFNLQPFGMPKPGSPLLGFGNQSGSPTVDLLGAARPSGFVKLFTGTATAGAAKTITNSGASFPVNGILSGATIKIISGTGSGQTKTIASNTLTVITVDGNWKTNPDSTSVYEIYLRAQSSSGTATAGSTTTLTDSNAAWGVNMWAGYTLKTDAGTGSGQTLLIISNTATVLTFAAATAPDSTTTYRLYKGTDENTLNAGVGCYEYGQSAIKETTTVRTGSNAIRIPGAGYHDFVIPVSAVSTTVTVYTQWDAAYSGTKPSMSVLNGTEAGVANATATATGSSGSWEQLSLNFTPTASGIVTIRLVSSSTTPTGNAFFDDFNVT